MRTTRTILLVLSITASATATVLDTLAPGTIGFQVHQEFGEPLNGADAIRERYAAAKQGIAPTYTGKLLAAYEDVTKDERRTTELIPPSAVHHSLALVEPLSKRELEVLRLLGTELSGPEIARELMVSPNTMRTHTKNIYSKLGVHNRRSAVRRAAELSLL